MANTVTGLQQLLNFDYKLGLTFRNRRRIVRLVVNVKVCCIWQMRVRVSMIHEPSFLCMVLEALQIAASFIDAKVIILDHVLKDGAHVGQAA